MWQALYEDVNDSNFEIICVAEDTMGEEAAGQWFDAANASYVCIVDPTHMISTLFGFIMKRVGSSALTRVPIRVDIPSRTSWRVRLNLAMTFITLR